MEYRLVEDFWDSKEYIAINRVIASNRLSMGDEVRHLEREMAEWHGVDHAVMVNSGSSANLIGVTAMRFKYETLYQAKKRVIVPSVGWSTTYSPLFYNNFQPVFVDIDQDDYCIDVDEVAKYIDEDTFGVFAVNLLGEPCNYDALVNLCEKNGCLLFEDNCESMGALYNDRLTGTIGVFGTLSFFFSHHMTTIEGGMILTNDSDFADICRSLRAHGWVRELSEDSALRQNADRGEFKNLFNFVLPGFNVRPTEISGAIGRAQLLKLEESIRQRRYNRILFDAVCEKYPFIKPQKISSGNSAFSFAFTIEDETVCDQATLARIFKENHVEARPVASGNFTSHVCAKKYMQTENVRLPNAEKLEMQGMMLGNHPRPMDLEISYLDELLSKVLRS